MNEITAEKIKEAFWIVNAYLKPFNSMKSLLETKREVFKMTDEEYEEFKSLIKYSRAYEQLKNGNQFWRIDPIACAKFYSTPLSNRIAEIILSDPLCFVPEILEVMHSRYIRDFFNNHTTCADFWDSGELFRRLIS